MKAYFIIFARTVFNSISRFSGIPADAIAFTICSAISFSVILRRLILSDPFCIFSRRCFIVSAVRTFCNSAFSLVEVFIIRHNQWLII